MKKWFVSMLVGLSGWAPVPAESLWFDSIPPHPAVAVWRNHRWIPLAVSGRCVESGPISGKTRFRLSHPGYQDSEVEFLVSDLQGPVPVRIPRDPRQRLTLKPRLARVLFETYPSRAEVYLLLPGGQKDYLGLSGNVVVLNLASVLGGTQSGLFYIELCRPGHQSVMVPIPSYSLYSDGVVRWPGQGTYVLPSQSYLPQAALMMAPLVAGMVWMAHKRRRRHRETQVSKRQGLRLGPYRLLERVAQGGSATVYKAVGWDGGSMEPLAIKVLHPEILGLNTDSTMILKEVEALRRLDHPGIVKVSDWGEELGRAYLAMEWVDGQDLRQTIAASPLGLAASADVLRQILSALQHAHQKGIVHRDLKPENILINGKGRTKLSDFGLATNRPNSAPSNSAPSLSGTPGYLAPELLSGHPAWCGSDLFAVGVIACELLTGHLPKHNPELPTMWKAWIQSLLEADPKQRVASAQQALETMPSRCTKSRAQATHAGDINQGPIPSDPTDNTGGHPRQSKGPWNIWPPL
ncbi:serine/threonine protein kinase [bacterium]|nr:serine/threonine protein kinase [bacterium]